MTMRRVHRIPCLLAVASLMLAVTAHAADDDIVLLKNGGRLRGSVVEEDPQKGVRIKLADGTLRAVAASDVKEVQYGGKPATVVAPPPAVVAPPLLAAPFAPVMSPAIGSIHVEASAPGRVIVDGGVVGPAPADVQAAAAGRHKVRVEFDAGGSRQEIVLVQGGQTAQVRLEAPIRDTFLLGPLGIEAALKLGYGSNDYKFGVGGRAGLSIYGLYGGFSVVHFLGTEGISTTTIGGEVGYGFTIHIADAPGWAVIIRPLLGFGTANYAAGAVDGFSAASASSFFLQPGGLIQVRYRFVNFGVAPSAFIPTSEGFGSANAFVFNGEVGVTL